MCSLKDSDMQVAILLVSIPSEYSLSGTLYAIKMMDSNKETWEYVSSCLIEEIGSQKIAENMEGKGPSSMEAFTRKKNDRSGIHFYNYNKNGYIELFCKSSKGSGGKEKEDKPKLRSAFVWKIKNDNKAIMDS